MTKNPIFDFENGQSTYTRVNMVTHYMTAVKIFKKVYEVENSCTNIPFLFFWLIRKLLFPDIDICVPV